jgi:DNA-directed RNA polymerase specialized sigma24 family protein
MAKSGHTDQTANARNKAAMYRRSHIWQLEAAEEVPLSTAVNFRVSSTNNSMIHLFDRRKQESGNVNRWKRNDWFAVSTQEMTETLGQGTKKQVEAVSELSSINVPSSPAGRDWSFTLGTETVTIGTLILFLPMVEVPCRCHPTAPSRAGSDRFRPAIRPRFKNCGSATFNDWWDWRAPNCTVRRAADEEDVALSAFDSFCRNAAQGRFPQLFDRDGLWKLLVLLTARKAAHQRRDEQRLKRGGGAEPEPLLEEVLSREPSPQFAAEVAEECQRLLQSLNDRELEAVALARMEGYSVEEIAVQLGYSPRSIKRKLQLIRGIWEKEQQS